MVRRFHIDVTIAVWVGYDNGDGKRRSLGTSETGAHVALPIFEPILQAVWAKGIAPKTPLNGPSPEARRDLIDLPIDYSSGDWIKGGQHFVEHFRRGSDGQVDDTEHKIASSDSPNTTDHVTLWHKHHRDQAAVAQHQETEGRVVGCAARLDSACERRFPALEQRLAPTRPSPGLRLFLGRAFQLGLAL
jgi:membrane carboxypeptidase/penicillin-binding protein